MGALASDLAPTPSTPNSADGDTESKNYRIMFRASVP